MCNVQAKQNDKLRQRFWKREEQLIQMIKVKMFKNINDE